MAAIRPFPLTPSQVQQKSIAHSYGLEGLQICRMQV